MKNPIVIFTTITILILTLGAVFFSLNSSRSGLMRKEDDAVLPTQEATMEPANESTEEAGDDTADKNMDDNNIAKSRYVQYSKSALESASGNRRVLFFYASWCPTCKPADTDFTQNSSNIPEDVTVIRVNYNDPDTDQEEKDLAKKYGITYQHTFVQIDSAGKELTKWNGGQTDALLSNIK